ncbi:MAG: fructosamine kinase family protein [Oscillatoriales cyanobacterium C42_A2020_001]|nr:fructosamine kinase family protein [Leptolyngbyaceae cyanobacterium C42_A2020_001]
MWDSIATHISQVTGQSFQIEERRSVSGGCINSGYALSNKQQTYFVKLNQAPQIAMFEAEAEGLDEIVATHTIKVPKPICWGTAGNSAYLVLEWLDLGHSGGAVWSIMGQRLAAMHRVTSASGFGWKMNNTIGSTSQPNPWTANWVTFWQEHRLGFQFKLANRRGGHFPKQDRLLATIPQLLAGHDPQPSLVHGDLWSGNAAVTRAGEPVIFDPATYYGDREVDLAMTELFGSFPADFYRAYNQAFPLDSGYQQRKVLYNLYHILNHFNLFGGSYDSQANRMIDQILNLIP